jgi:hypothetical protein
MNIPAAIDLMQGRKSLRTPEIRVWCHPHRIDKSGDDYYLRFSTFKEAEDFIKEHPEAEDSPLIAFRGLEINIYDKFVTTKELIRQANLR